MTRSRVGRGVGSGGARGATGLRGARTGLFAAVAIVVTAITLAITTPAMAVSTSPDSAAEQTTYTYQASDAAIVNPERGLYTSFNSTDDMTESRVKSVADSGESIVHFDIDLSAYRTRAIDSTLLVSIQAAFDLLRKYGLKGWIHISYSPNFDSESGKYRTICLDPTVIYPDVPENVDTSLFWVQAHLGQLKGILANNDNAIMGFDAGIIGEWGEWHCSAHQLLAPGNKEKVIAALLENLPADRQIALRHPYDVFDPAVYGVQGPNITWSDATSRFSDYQDCYASEQPGDEGTWVTNLTNTPKADQAEISLLKTNIGVLGENHIIGGNACNVSVRSTCPIAVTGNRANTGEPTMTDPFPAQYNAPELPNMHFTYLNGSFNPKQTANIEYQQQGCWDQITQSLGYRLQLQSAQVPSVVSPGATEHVTIDLTNAGWAAIVNPRPAYLVLRGDSATYRLPLAADPRSWASGASASIDENVVMPSDLAPGSYSLALWLPDASDALRGKPAYSVQLANVGTWNAQTGENVLGTVTVAAAGPTPPPTAGPTDAPATPAAGIPSSPAANASLAATGLAAAPPLIALGIAGVALLAGIGILTTRRRPRRTE